MVTLRLLFHLQSEACILSMEYLVSLLYVSALTTSATKKYHFRATAFHAERFFCLQKF